MAAREVVPPLVVRHAFDVRTVARVRGQRAFVVEGQPVAAAFGHQVIGQPVQPDAPAKASLQVAEFAVHRKAAARGDRRRDRRIAVRRDVPVIGRTQLDTAAGGELQVRRQPARFALVVQRKAQRGQAQDRHIQKAQFSALGHAHAGVQVQIELACAQDPVRRSLCRRAGSWCMSPLITRSCACPRMSTRSARPPALVCAKWYSGSLHEAFHALHLQLHFGPAEVRTLEADAHLALRHRQVLGLVVAQLVGANHHASLSQFDAALRLQCRIRLPGQFVGTQVQRRLVALHIA